MKKRIMLLLKLTILSALVFGIYVVATILYAQYTDYKPDPEEYAEVVRHTTRVIEKDEFILYDWNIGYCGLGKESDFFYDGGKMVRPPRHISAKNFKGFLSTLEKWKTDADFINIQEIDRDSRRSYGVDQMQGALLVLDSFNVSFGKNYDVRFVPMPFTNPMGGVFGGICTFSRYAFTGEPLKIAFPSNFPWPKGLFFLDRCFLINRFELQNGKQLTVINTHNSAYDGGELKKQEMEYFHKYIVDEYDKGNYVIVGGDWNQIPPGYKPKDAHSNYEEMPVPKGYVPEGWTWAYDPDTPSNRKVDAPYESGKTYTTIIDFYLLSPNIELVEVKGLPNGFEYSDHQPVRMVCKLKEQSTSNK